MMSGPIVLEIEVPNKKYVRQMLDKIGKRMSSYFLQDMPIVIEGQIARRFKEGGIELTTSTISIPWKALSLYTVVRRIKEKEYKTGNTKLLKSDKLKLEEDYGITYDRNRPRGARYEVNSSTSSKDVPSGLWVGDGLKSNQPILRSSGFLRRNIFIKKSVRKPEYILEVDNRAGYADELQRDRPFMSITPYIKERIEKLMSDKLKSIIKEI